MAESEEELKSLLMKVSQEESENVGLKLNIQKTKIMATGPITSWQIDGETMEIGADFILGGSKIIAYGDCSHEIKRNLLLECESWTVKKAEHRRIDAFEPWSWRRLFRVSWTARRANQSILKEISPEYSLEGLMLKVKLKCFGYLRSKELTHW